ncbi:MAG: hypothetical protein RL337_1595 [Bacteroidota bacterium]|jgi:hypothetical protein
MVLFGLLNLHLQYQKYGRQMILQERIEILNKLSAYMAGNEPAWAEAKERAARENPWFALEFVEKAVNSITNSFLDPQLLTNWAIKYGVPDQQSEPKKVGLVMAGNIPLVGFHDFLSVFISGHIAVIKPSSKDEILIKHIASELIKMDERVSGMVFFAPQLAGLDAYIATGSNNSSRYFDYYFGKFPNIIRRNRTSVAIIDGTETAAELDLLADDMQTYFGLGCRNVTQLYVPTNYDFIPLLTALKKYEYYLDFHKYKHNYDYHLALLIMGNKYYMNNDSLVFAENESPFSPVSQVHYQFYAEQEQLSHLGQNTDIQCIVGHDYIPFGSAQAPSLTDYADGTDTMAFLQTL